MEYTIRVTRTKLIAIASAGLLVTGVATAGAAYAYSNTTALTVNSQLTLVDLHPAAGDPSEWPAKAQRTKAWIGVVTVAGRVCRVIGSAQNERFVGDHITYSMSC